MKKPRRDSDDTGSRYPKQPIRRELWQPPGGSDMTMAEALGTVLRLAELSPLPKSKDKLHRQAQAVALVRALAVGSHGLKTP